MKSAVATMSGVSTVKEVKAKALSDERGRVGLHGFARRRKQASGRASGVCSRSSTPPLARSLAMN